MKNTKKIIALISALLFIPSVFAATGSVSETTTESTSLEVLTAPKLIGKTSTGVTLEWDKVNAAETYIVKYSKESVANSTDPNAQYTDETDQITETGTTVTPLDPNTSYFFSIVAVDKEGNESNTFSDELNVTTDADTAGLESAPAQSGSTLAISNVVVVDNKTLSLEFSAPLSIEPVKVKITKTSDNSDLPVVEVVQDPTAPNKAVAKVATVIDSSSSYSLTVISAKDANGNNIQEGVNGLKEFTTSETIAIAPELNAAGTGATATGTLTATELPATGTKENFIIIAALLLSLGLVIAFRKKIAR